MTPIIVYSPQPSARLRYVLDWVLVHRLQLPYVLVHNTRDIPSGLFFISYGAHLIDALSIPSAGLLSEADIKNHSISTGNWYDIPTLYATNQDGYTLPFDLFSAVFFLLSRYEEYYNYTPDKHGRYPATDSFLYKNGWLQRPLVDEWIHLFRGVIQSYVGIQLQGPSFSHSLTYDIDIAYSYLGKGLQRNIGGWARDMLAGNVAVARERTSVLLKNAKDPFDSFDLLAELHGKAHVTPLYFILCALHNGPHDKNISPRHPLMVKLIRRLMHDGSKVYIHPSYHAQGGELMAKERKVLEHITHTVITSSRQHYIKNVLPYTYRQLHEQGILHDYSMGYATHLGFRAGTSHAFPWYDLVTELEVSLTIHPFCFMDTAARYEEKLDVVAAFKELHMMTQLLKQNDGHLTTIFHNFSLGTSPQWIGWARAYEDFVMELA